MNTRTHLSGTIQSLLRDHVHSVEALEALLLLRSEPARWWSDNEVASRLGIASSLARSALAALVRSGLCGAARGGEGPTIYGPASPSLARAVDELAGAYQVQRVEILVFISRSAISRVRSDALRTFAEAFRVVDRGKNEG